MYDVRRFEVARRDRGNRSFTSNFVVASVVLCLIAHPPDESTGPDGAPRRNATIGPRVRSQSDPGGSQRKPSGAR